MHLTVQKCAGCFVYAVQDSLMTVVYEIGDVMQCDLNSSSTV